MKMWRDTKRNLGRFRKDPAQDLNQTWDSFNKPARRERKVLTYEKKRMTKTAAEVVIIAINALGAGILLFVSGVVQKMMNGLEPPEFKSFAKALGPAAMSDRFAVAIATIPIFAVFYYFVEFGFRQWWFTAGIAVWMGASSITKIVNLPIYN